MRRYGQIIVDYLNGDILSLEIIENNKRKRDNEMSDIMNNSINKNVTRNEQIDKLLERNIFIHNKINIIRHSVVQARANV